MLEWCKKQLKKGLSEKELEELLYQHGHTGRETQILIAKATGRLPEDYEGRINQAVINWTVDRLAEGFSKYKIKQLLSGEGYEENEVRAIMATAKRKAKEKKKGINEIVLSHDLPSKRKKQENPDYKDTISSHQPKTLQQIIHNESKMVWTGIAVFIVIVLLLTGTLIFALYSSPEWDKIWNRKQVDGISPYLSIPITKEYIGPEKTRISCMDNGKDYTSGCNEKTFRFLVTETAFCSKDYPIYTKEIDTNLEKGFLCVSAKDNEGNIGFSEPVPVSFDFRKPATIIEQKEESFSKSFSVNITDQDPQSGIRTCFYRVINAGQTVRDWQERYCNSSIIVPVGKNGCSQEECILEAYAIDNAGNEGTRTSQGFLISAS